MEVCFLKVVFLFFLLNFPRGAFIKVVTLIPDIRVSNQSEIAREDVVDPTCATTPLNVKGELALNQSFLKWDKV